MRYAIIENVSREVVNVVEWDGAEWLPPRAHIVIPSDIAQCGQIYDEENNSFTDPTDPEE